MQWWLFIGLVLPCMAAPAITPLDVVDKNKVEQETTLSDLDFAKVPEKEIDLRQIGIDVKEDPTMGNKAEGDIAVSSLKKFLDDQSPLARNAIRQYNRRWPNNEIPYALSSQYGSYARSVIAKAMNEYHQKTCVRFVPRDVNKHRDYVYIHPDDGCYSLVGRTGGRQPLSLDSGCIQGGTIVHELMHAVGFFHEQSRFDRDNYIEIAWSNVVNGADDQFEKYGMNVIDQMNEPYDYGSIMHYGPYAFSSNGKRTIVARKPGAGKMGQRVQFSDIDLKKINKLYQCNNAQTGASTQVTDAKVGNKTNAAIPDTNTPNKEICQDYNWRCAFWSISLFGYCADYPEIRDIICPKSCRTCTQKPSSKELLRECTDKSPICKHIKQGSCVSPVTKITCQRKCGLCEDDPACSDESNRDTCQSVVALGLCQKRSDCSKTCGFCS